MGEAKRKNQRECPALGCKITAEECGRGRNSRIACPTDCPHNPFAPDNYLTMYNPLEERFSKQLRAMLAKDLNAAEARELERVEGADDVMAANALSIWLLQGSGRLRRWLDEGAFRSFRNDEQVLAKWLATLRPALIEIQCRASGHGCLVRDLWRPEKGEQLLLDDAFTQRATRYQALLTWTHETPTGLRITGAALEVPVILPRGPREVIDCLLEHHGAPAADRECWILEHMALLAESLAAVDAARDREGLLACDATHHTARYRVHDNPEHLLAVLAALPNVVHEEPGDAVGESLSILDPRGDRESLAGVQILATVECHGRAAELTGVGRQSHAVAREIFESAAGALVSFEGEDQHLPEDARPGPPVDPDLVPPCLLEHPPKFDFTSRWFPPAEGEAGPLMSDASRQQYQAMLAEPVPALGNLTPRQLAADPARRTGLVLWAKTQLTRSDELRLRGVDVDFNAFLAELGLEDLARPAAPLGEYVPEDDKDLEDAYGGDDDDEGYDEEVWDEEDEQTIDLPPCPQQALSEEEVAERFRQAREQENGPADSAANWPEIVDMIRRYRLSDLSRHELKAYLACTLLVPCLLHPTRPPGILPDARRAARELRRMLGSLHRHMQQHRESIAPLLERWMNSSPQPAVCQLVVGVLAGAAEQAGRRKARPEQMAMVSLALLATVWEFCHWPPSPRPPGA